MRQVKLIVSNWKMNLNINDAEKLINNLEKIELNSKSKIQNIVCPQFLLIPYISNLLSSSKIILGSQDCHFKKSGSFTGDSSVELLKYYNCKYVILGHSERRSNYAESNLSVRKKCEIARNHNISPIVCIGESIDLRRKRKYLDFIINQLDECVEKNLRDIVIAYEPIWSIGSGMIPSFSEIQEIKRESINFLKEEKKIKDIKILYGGSVNSKNFNNIIKESGVDGALIGSASINADEITKIITNVNFN